MKIKPPKHLGKLRFVQYTDVSAVMDQQRSALRFYLLILFFSTAVSGLLIAGCIVYNRAWSDWLVTGFMTFGTVLGLRAYLPLLTRLQVGMVCDRGVGYCWFRRDGSLVRDQWYAFQPETTLEEWRDRDGRTWNMQDKLVIAFCEGRKRCFVASYLVQYEDDTNLEFMRQASKAYKLWRRRLGPIPVMETAE